MVRRPAAPALVLAIAATIGLAGPVSRVLACSCAELQPGQALAGAQAALVGVVVGARDPAAGNPNISTGDPILYTLQVEESLKGDLAVGSRLQVSTSRDGASCGYPMAVGQRVRLHLHVADGGLATNLCSGNELIAEGVPLPAPAEREEAPGPPPLPVLIGAGVLALVAAASLFAFRGGRRPGELS